jgi:quercetin dioxygenase-like cupin family protein
MSTRREFVFSSLMAALAMPAFAQKPGSPPASETPADRTHPISSQAVPFPDLQLKKAADGRETRPCLLGRTTNVDLEMHQTKLPPGKMPHPPHRHPHDELFLVRRGTVTVTISGKSTTLGPGGFAIVTNNDEHGVKNTGTVPAEYFVVALTKQGMA